MLFMMGNNCTKCPLCLQWREITKHGGVYWGSAGGWSPVMEHWYQHLMAYHGVLGPFFPEREQQKGSVLQKDDAQIESGKG